MVINFSEIKLSDIEGNMAPSSDFHKVIANILYNTAESIDFVEPAMKINKGLPVDLTKKEILEIKRMVVDPKANVFAFARKAMDDFVTARLEAEEAKDEETKD